MRTDHVLSENPHPIFSDIPTSEKSTPDDARRKVLGGAGRYVENSEIQGNSDFPTFHPRVEKVQLGRILTSGSYDDALQTQLDQSPSHHRRPVCRKILTGTTWRGCSPNRADPETLSQEETEMGADKVYGSSSVKRQRATKTEKAARLDALFAITADIEPATVRQVYYQASVRGVVDKTEQGYKMVVSALSEMRLRGRLPWVWIADNTRWQRRPTTYNSVEDALEETAAFYRKSLWNEADVYVEIWLEKDALSGVIYPINRAVRRAVDGRERLFEF